MDRRDSGNTLPFIHDVLIVGAGPCGLAVAARLREHTPSAIFTDAEHHRYHWIKEHARRAAIKSSRTGRVRSQGGDSKQQATGAAEKCVYDSSPAMIVLDNSGSQWMTKWNRLFTALEISHLRSPMFFHPDPHDRDGLLAFAHLQGREGDCIEIAGCVGKEISKHQKKKKRTKAGVKEHAKPPTTIDERDRKDYFAPPSDLFRTYCDWIADRYGLCDEELIQVTTVSDIDYDFVQHISPGEKIFTIGAGDSNYYARTVVLAVGAGNMPSIPKPFPQQGGACACHAFQAQDKQLMARLRAKKTANVLVIGGGLTSAQIADRVIRKGATKVWLLMRGPFKIKPFDVDLSWMAKFKNHEKASFWSADTDEERSDLVKSARGGGSITPRYAKILQQHIASGKLSIHTHTEVREQNFSIDSETWSIHADPDITDLPEIHHVYFATGVQSDFRTLKYLQKLVDKYPVESYDGLPALTDNLMWNDDVPLFMTGKFAALRLGPGAGNLEGARVGAERIAWALQDRLGIAEGPARVADEVERDTGEYRFYAGIGSRFETLEDLTD